MVVNLKGRAYQMRKKDYDFAGYVTRNDVTCADGLVIKQGAFTGNEDREVPLVWQHDYSQPGNTLGKIRLVNVEDGVYGYGYFNETPTAANAKELIRHGDIRAMSIGANKIRKMGQNVVHGNIYEVSLVLAGANEGATIEWTNLEHSAVNEDFENGEAIIESDFLLHSAEDEADILKHAARAKDSEDEEDDEEEADKAKAKKGKKPTFIKGQKPDFGKGDAEDEDEEDEGENGEGAKDPKDSEDKNIKHADTNGGSQVADKAQSSEDDNRTIKDVLDTLNDDQKSAVAYLLADAAGDTGSDEEDDEETAKHSEDIEGEDTLKHSVFNNQNSEAEGYVATDGTILTHSDANNILAQAASSKVTSLVDVLANAGVAEDDLKHGITNIEALFPNTQAQGGITVVNPTGKNVDKILASISKTPFSRVKNLFADITQDEARARGYIKGNQKLDSIADIFFRETTPGTIYVRQKLDRDDVLDIADNGIDIVSFANAQMQAKLKEEIVKAVLVGDGRERLVNGAPNPDKIDEQRIRPIAKDNDLFAIKVEVDQLKPEDGKTDFVSSFVTAQAAYQGSGNAMLYIHPLALSKLRLLTDANGRWIFGGYANGGIPTAESVAAALGVSGIVEYLGMDPKQMIFVDLADYKLGAAKNGQVTNFDFFDIDFNQYKYLSETRLSGALVLPKSAIVITLKNLDTTGLDAITSVPREGMEEIPTWVTDSGTKAAPTTTSTTTGE